MIRLAYKLVKTKETNSDTSLRQHSDFEIRSRSLKLVCVHEAQTDENYHHINSEKNSWLLYLYENANVKILSRQNWQIISL